MTTNLQTISLNKLVASDRNVRKTGGGDGIDELAASIVSHGLLQSLVVQPARRGKYAVIAGGRRLRALRTLQQQGTLPSDYEMPCSVIAIDQAAEELGLAENIVRAPMHPADQFDAFCVLVEQGMTVADIAARFHFSEDHVVRRLKLGKLSPVILQAYRDDEIDLGMAQAFTLSDDHAQQERAFCDLKEMDCLHPSRIRAFLTHGEVPSSDRRVVFIGQDAYVAAGGAIRRDLFETEDEFYILDEALLEQLVLARLAETAETVKAEGWQWVKVDLDADHATYAQYVRECPEPGKLSRKAQKKFDALSAEHDALVDQLTDDEDEELLAKIDALQSGMDALQPAAVWTAEIMSVAGAIVSLDYEGGVRIERGLCTQGRKAAAKDTGESAAPKSPYSARLLINLSAHKTAALRAVLSTQPRVALHATPRTARTNPGRYPRQRCALARPPKFYAALNAALGPAMVNGGAEGTALLAEPNMKGNNMSNNNKPALLAYAVKDRGKNKKAIWTRIGAAWPHENGKGFTIELEAMPLEGRLVLTEPKVEPTDSQEAA